MGRRFCFLLAVTLLTLASVSLTRATRYEARKHWWDLAQNELMKALNVRDNWNVAKNIVFFLGDGMGITPSTAARIYKGQQNGRHGEEGYLEWERFPNAGLIKTYNVDRQVPDSAATATAYLCGVKANYYTLGLDPEVALGDCSSSQEKEYHLDSILKWAQDAGKDTGFVTTTRVTHATPAALYAHSAHRNWECDSKLGDLGKGCKDIADQLVTESPGKDIKVIMGGGRMAMGYPIDTDSTSGCPRTDQRNLVNEWLTSKTNHGISAAFVSNREELNKVNMADTEYLLGLFADSHMDFETDRLKNYQGQPSLKEMALSALEFLKKGDQGYFLLVEGGRIDHALHLSHPKRALEETVQLDNAVRAVLEEVDLEDTMVIVTADHSHVMTINGYPERGNDILGLGDVSEVDNLPYTTLMFTNGEGYDVKIENGKAVRHDPREHDYRSKTYKSHSAVPKAFYNETHGGEDVAIYAVGPMSHLFHRLHEQHYIAHAMAYSACIGPSKNNCERPPHARQSHYRQRPEPVATTRAPTPEVPDTTTRPIRRQRPGRRPVYDTIQQAVRDHFTPKTHNYFEGDDDGVRTPSVSTAFAGVSADVDSEDLPGASFPPAPAKIKFPTVSPILQDLLDDNEDKIVSHLGRVPVKHFTNIRDVTELIGQSSVPHSN